MVVEAVQNYVNLVNGLSKMTRDRALQIARALLAQAGLEHVANDAEKRVTRLADEILAASRANRELVEKLVASEVDKAAAHWGFVRSEDVDALREEIAELRRSLVKATVENAGGPDRATRPAKKAPTAARATTARKSASQGPPLGGAADEPGVDPNLPDPPLGEPLVTDPGQPGQTPLIQTPAEVAAESPPSPPEASRPVKSAAKRTAAKKTPAKKTPAKKTPAQKTPAQKTPAQKTAATPVAERAAAEQPVPKKPTARKSPASKGAATVPSRTAATAPADQGSGSLSEGDSTSVSPAGLPAPAAPLTTPLPGAAAGGSSE